MISKKLRASMQCKNFETHEFIEGGGKLATLIVNVQLFSSSPKRPSASMHSKSRNTHDHFNK